MGLLVPLRGRQCGGGWGLLACLDAPQSYALEADSLEARKFTAADKEPLKTCMAFYQVSRSGCAPAGGWLDR